LGIHLTCLAESLAIILQGCFVNLPIALDKIYWSSTTVGKGSDLIGALILSHHSAANREGFYNNHCLVGSHPKVVSKGLVVDCLASLPIYA